jgi:cell division protein FtsZ
MATESAEVKSVDTPEASAKNSTRIKVIGLGGGGSNAVDNMVGQKMEGVEFIAANTDARALARSVAPVRLALGERSTKGLGVGGDHKLGMMAAQESLDEITRAIQGADLLFITAGMGGGTGTGSAPVVAEIARGLGILTIAVVTRPFSFEGAQRAKVAEEGIVVLKEMVDAIVVICNDRLPNMCEMNVSIDTAFKMVDDVLRQSVQGIHEVVTTVGHINLDFNDVKTIMRGAGLGWIAIGRGGGPTRAVDAARAAIAAPVFDFSIDRAKRILFNIIGNELTLAEINEAANIIKQVADPEAQIIFGFGADPLMDRMVKITLIATDFSEKKRKPAVSNDESFELAMAGDRQPFFRRNR